MGEETQSNFLFGYTLDENNILLWIGVSQFPPQDIPRLMSHLDINIQVAARRAEVTEWVLQSNITDNYHASIVSSHHRYRRLLNSLFAVKQAVTANQCN